MPTHSPFKKKRSRATIFTIVAFFLSLVFPFLAQNQKAAVREYQEILSATEEIAHGSIGMWLQTPAVYATTLPQFSATEKARSVGTVRMRVGQAVTIWVDFINTGTSVWHNTGKDFIALNVTDPSGRASVFRHKFWKAPYRPAVLQQGSVAPGETGRFVFSLQAPEQPGTYLEQFQLVAEHLAWFPDGKLEVPIVILPAVPAYQAGQAQQTYGTVQLYPNEATTVWVDFLNTGTVEWRNSGKNFVALNVTDPSGRTSAFRHKFWKAWYRPGILEQPMVKPGETGRIRFALHAPTTPGVSVETFQLVAEHLTWIPGSRVQLTVITKDPAPPPAPGEPQIAIGLTAMPEGASVTANGSFALENDGVRLQTLASGERVTLSYAQGTYTAVTPTTTVSSPLPYRLAPLDEGAVLEVENFENRPAWNTALNDNRFRGALEFRYAESTNTPWLINHLALEQYLRGIAEASNSAPTEYLQALMIAARSYAYSHIQANTKHAAEHYTLDATYDQVYRGYNFELRNPKIGEAVESTRGSVVAYNDVPVITPYFSQSDGRTRSWEEVWSGGPYEWLKSVPDPVNEGFTLLGHGVGMSGRGAYIMASNGEAAQTILGHYYSGTTLKTIY